MTRLLLGQLGANGDCLYATVLARQLRHDYPDAHITWAVSTQCLSTVRNNPDIDETWHVPIRGWGEHEQMWRLFEREAFRRYKRGEFDKILISQIWPDNFQNYDNTIRPSILRSYGKPITVPIETVIAPTAEEQERVQRFAKAHDLVDHSHVVLFECSSKSGQSFITPEQAQLIAKHLYTQIPDAIVILCTNLEATPEDHRTLYAGELTLREIALLTHYCTHFIGCGSGATVAATSIAAKPLPNIQLLVPTKGMLATFTHDFEYFGLDRREIIEIVRADPIYIANALATMCRNGFSQAHAEFNEQIKNNFEYYRQIVQGTLLRRCRYLDAAQSLLITARRYGWTPELLRFGFEQILPHIHADPSSVFPSVKTFSDKFRSALTDGSVSPVDEPVQRHGGFYDEEFNNALT
ncbi:glycosyltransferase family 9 protein [Methylobacterium sp. E-066]|uniref:glycosyltransferase family 9 protein n=1 Tax=Methylobacterium sp. E-066 TaxID=2836584 RepID=UPI001FBBF403|nr:hypothetical protein [Methylobacterium sp. E-066]MCJ2142953.1 hypothetical protein [Methylobacterium sp. E-066]